VGKKAPLGKKRNRTRCRFTLAAATAERVKGNCFQYDECASGRRIYAYVDNNPIGNTDPLGLFELQSFPESVVNFSGGIGDVILLGQGQKLRDLAGVNGGINKCSGAYGAGDPSGGIVGVSGGLAAQADARDSVGLVVAVGRDITPAGLVTCTASVPTTAANQS